MKRFNKVTLVSLTILTALLGLTVLAGCSGAAPTTTAPAATKPAQTAAPAPAAAVKTIVLSTNTPGASAEALAQNFAQLVGKVSKGAMKVMVVPNQGVPQNVQMVLSGEATIGLHANTTDGYRLYNGIEEYKTLKSTSLRTLWPSIPVAVFGVALAGSKANTIADLKGLTVATNRPGTTARNTLTQFLAAAGYGPKDVTIREVGATAVDEVRDGAADVAWMSAGHPFSSITELEVLKPIKFIDLPADMSKKVNDQLYEGQSVFAPQTLKKGEYYKTTTKDSLMSLLNTFVIATKDSDPELMYTLTKLFWENKTELEGMFAPTAQITKELIPYINSSMFPLHDGALKYYKEKGWKVTQ